MKIALLSISLFVFFSGIYAKLDFLSDYRQAGGWREDEDYSSNIERFARYLQNKEAEAEALAEAKQEEEEDKEEDADEQGESVLNSEPPFVYNTPKSPSEAKFGFPPYDPRFFSDDKNAPNIVKPDSKPTNELEKRKETTSEPVNPETVSHLSVDSGEAKPFYSARLQSEADAKLIKEDDNADIYFIAAVAGCSAAAVVGVVAVGISCYRLHKNAKAAADVEYPAYGVTGPNKDISPTSGDRRLAQSAQMYHYQHQKQQIIAMESRATNERHGSISDAESDEENEEGDYTVYECPGLASTGEMEVKNPLFQDDPTPASPAKPPMESSTEKTKELPK